MNQLSLTTLRRLQGTPLEFNAKARVLDRPSPISIAVHDRVRFSTPHIDAKGTVLEVDHGAEYPLKVEWHTASGDKRITCFATDEFITINKE